VGNNLGQRRRTLSLARIGPKLTDPSSLGGTPPAPFDNFTLVQTLPLPGTYDWDFLTYDEVAGTILIGRRTDGVSIIDVRNLDALKFVASVADTYGSNGVTILPDLRLGVSNNGGALFLLTAVHSLLLFLRQQGGHGHSLHAA